MRLTWEYEGVKHPVMELPFCVYNTEKTLVVSLTFDVDLANTFLYTEGEYEGLMLAKPSYLLNYRPIGAYSLAPSCFLGDVEKDQKIDLSVKITFPDSGLWKGEQLIPIYVGNGENIEPLNLDSKNIFWRKDETETAISWATSSEDAEEKIWINEV